MNKFDLAFSAIAPSIGKASDDSHTVGRTLAGLEVSNSVFAPKAFS